MGVALSKITDRPIDVFAVSEQDLTDLPASSLSTFSKLDNIAVYKTTLRLNPYIQQEEEALKLRVATYHFNLLSNLGMKKCMLCGCEVPEIIQGAHIWGVSEIRKDCCLTDEQRYAHAINGHNGLWLCANHHKLFDSNILVIKSNGYCMVKTNIPTSQERFIRDSVIQKRIQKNVICDDFLFYLSERNKCLNFRDYTMV